MNLFSFCALVSIVSISLLVIFLISQYRYFSGKKSPKNPNDLVAEVYGDLEDINTLLANSHRHSLEEDLYKKIVNLVKERFLVDSVALYLHEEGVIELISSLGMSPDILEHISCIDVNEDSVTGRAVIYGEPQFQSIDVYPDNRIRKQFKDDGINFLISYPLRSHGRVLGVISLALSRDNLGLLKERDFFLLICNQLGTIFENICLNKKINELSSSDTLTGLVDKRAFESQLKSKIELFERYGTVFTLVVINIDDFSGINTTFGLDLGDRILVSTVKRIQESLRVTDLFARSGGDEFMVLLNGTGIGDGSIAIERIRKSIEEKYIPDLDGHITISLGATQCVVGDSREAVLKRGLDALSIAKDSGKNRYSIC